MKIFSIQNTRASSADTARVQLCAVAVMSCRRRNNGLVLQDIADGVVTVSHSQSQSRSREQFKARAADSY